VVTQPTLHRFALCTVDGDALGTVVFERAWYDPGEIIRHGPGGDLRVVHTILPERVGDILVLFVEPV
jgi:hypothetical protein